MTLLATYHFQMFSPLGHAMSVEKIVAGMDIVGFILATFEALSSLPLFLFFGVSCLELRFTYA